MSRRTSATSARPTRTRLLPTLAAGLGVAALAACSGGGSAEPAVPDVEARDVVEQDAEEVTDVSEIDEVEDVDLDALLGNKGADTGSRLLGVQSCAEVQDVIAPLLQPHFVVRSDEVHNRSYPKPGHYEYRCAWGDPDDQYFHVSVHGAADWDEDTREDILAVQREGYRDLAPHVVDDERHWNLVLIADGDNDAHSGRYAMHVASPSAPKSAITGWVSVRYGLGSEIWAPKGEAPSDGLMTEVLLGLAEDATHD